MADTAWHRQVLTIVKQFPGLTARQIHGKVGLRRVVYPEVGHVLRGLERLGQVRSREESTGDWLRERTWWPV
jgi:hypothetical protein